MKDKWKFWKLALHPVPELEKFDTGLRYTDILFGFVIRELFLRLQNWTNLDYAVRWHLVVGLTLVLGSWIGFRKSLNRPRYQLKFFNLPLFRFLFDQLMLILYFRIAVLTPAAGTLATGKMAIPNSEWEAATTLARHTNKFVVYVFILYFFWDLFGIWMNKTVDRDGVLRYPKEGPGKDTISKKEGARYWLGILITMVCLLFFSLLWLFADCFAPWKLFVATTVLLLVYRWLKEIRTSYQLLQPV